MFHNTPTFLIIWRFNPDLNPAGTGILCVFMHAALTISGNDSYDNLGIGYSVRDEAYTGQVTSVSCDMLRVPDENTTFRDCIVTLGTCLEQGYGATICVPIG